MQSVSQKQPVSLRIHKIAALQPGPKLIVLGAVHGNETCGTRAIARILSEIDSGALRIERGTLTLVPVTNPLAYQLGQRQGDRNLNRHLLPNSAPVEFEDRIANVLCPLLAEHDVLVDLHSFHTPGMPFVMVGPRNNNDNIEPFAHAAEEGRLVAHLGPRRFVEGWMDTYARGVARRRVEHPDMPPASLDKAYGIGTAEYIRTCGGYGVTLECGQHDDPLAPEVAYTAIRQALAVLGMADIPLVKPEGPAQLLRLCEVIDRAHAGDRFSKPWASFDRVEAGDIIGYREDGSVVAAPGDGHVVFPNPNALPGNEWFYFAKVSDRSIL